MKNNEHDKKIGILDWLIFLSIIVMFIMVYVPQSIWEEENQYKEMRRNRMTIISKAQDFYHEITGEYSSDFNQVAILVEAAMDSLIADSLFVGKRKIKLNDVIYDVNLETGYDIIVDTTFSILETIPTTVKDTVYSVIMKNIISNDV